MAQFQYTIKTSNGKTIKDVIEAMSREDAINKVRSKGGFIVSIKEVHSSKGGSSRPRKKSNRGKHTGLKVNDLCLFARNLAVVLSAGVPLLRSLEIISAQTESLALEKILKNVGDDIKGGLSLSEAIMKHPKHFSSLWMGIINVGEASGNLPFVLERLSDYLELRLEFERKIKSALVYPVMVSIFSGIAMLVFFKFILPSFIPVFQGFGMELPFMTELLFNMSEIVNKYFLIILIILTAFAFGFNFFRKSSFGKEFISRFILYVPILNKMIIVSALERFSSTMYILLESGVPIVYTLEVTAKSITNVVLSNKIMQVRDSIKQGNNLSDELAKVDIFPVLVSEVARIGEEAGNMSQMFQKIAQHYQKELSTTLERLVAAFEPIMMFFLGIGIGVIVVSLFLPMFKLSTVG